MYPSGSIPNRNISTSQNASFLSSEYFSPAYCCVFITLARCTRYPSSRSRSTKKYQLYVDSTTIPSISSLNGLSVSLILAGSLGSFFLNILLPFSSLIPKYELLECKSKAAYNLLTNLQKVKIGFFTLSISLTDMLGSCPLYDYQV